MDITIEQLKIEDIDPTLALIRDVITDSYHREFPATPNFIEAIEEEMDFQQQRFDQVRQTQSPSFFVAKQEYDVVGVLGYGNADETVTEAVKRLKGKIILLQSLTEMKSLFVKPALQHHGIGTKLFRAVLEEIKQKEYRYLAAFTGFYSGKAFWEKNLGVITVTLDHYDGEDKLWVWIKNIKNIR